MLTGSARCSDVRTCSVSVRPVSARPFRAKPTIAVGEAAVHFRRAWEHDSSQGVLAAPPFTPASPRPAQVKVCYPPLDGASSQSQIHNGELSGDCQPSCRSLSGFAGALPWSGPENANPGQEEEATCSQYPLVHAHTIHSGNVTGLRPVCFS